MSVLPPVPGATYTDQQVRELVGVEIIRAMPINQERVACACLRHHLTSNAPFVVLVDGSDPTVETVERLLHQDTPIPVFVAQASGAWEYVGRYNATHYSDKEEDIEEANTIHSDDIAGVLYLEPAEDPFRG